MKNQRQWIYADNMSEALWWHSNNIDISSITSSSQRYFHWFYRLFWLAEQDVLEMIFAVLSKLSFQ